MNQTARRYLLIAAALLSTVLPELVITFYPGALPVPGIVLHLAGTIVTAVLVYAIIMNMLRNLNGLKAHLRNIAEGVEELSGYEAKKRYAESGRLSSIYLAVNDLLEHFHHSFVSIKNLWRKDYEIGLDIQSNTNTIFKSAQSIESSTESLQGVTKELDQMVSDSMGLIDGIQRSLSEAQDVFHEQNAAVSESSASVEELISSINNIAGISESKRQNLQQLLVVVEKGKEDIEKTLNAFSSIGEATKFMQELVEMIEEVADRTNLLSMNAAIEAAHAGEAGKGFAVVAAEIKNLAESSRASTSSISSSLKTINRNIEETIEDSAALNTSIDGILSSVKETNDSMQEILNGMTEMSSGTIQISEALMNLQSTTSESKRHTDEIVAKSGMLYENLSNVEQQSLANFDGVNRITGDVHTISDSLGLLFDLSDNNSRNLENMRSRLDQIKNRKRFICDYLPPFQYVDNNAITGVFTEAVELMLSNIGENEHIEFMPWNEAQQLTMDEPDIFLMTIIKNKAREKNFRWIGPIVPDQSSLFKLREREDVVINSPSDLNKYKLGCVTGTWGYNYFQSKGIPAGNITTVETHSMSIQNLLLGNVDIIPITGLQLNHQLKMMNRSQDDVVQAFPITEFSTDLYMVTSLKTSDEVYDKYQKAFEAVKNTAAYKKIIEKYRR